MDSRSFEKFMGESLWFTIKKMLNYEEAYRQNKVGYKFFFLVCDDTDLA